MVNSTVTTLGAKRTNNAPAQFSLSLPSSASSSRNPSPVRGLRRKYSTKQGSDSSSLLDPSFDEAPGRLPVDVYDAMLPPWRARIRQMMVKRVERESEVIAKMQEYIRTPFWDAYFVYTSSLGTHTFFMASLPALYFFGYDDFGTSLIVILAFGVYITSVIKDLVCSPRPFSPPVTRLSISSHHLEYGLPSTHSTNSVSIAFFLFAIFYQLAYPSSNTTEPTLSPATFAFITFLLCIYTFSIVFGRLYTAMHSFTDCAMGVFFGGLIWWAETSWTGISIRLLSSSTPFHPATILINVFQFLNIGTPLPTNAASSSTPLGIVIQLGHGLGLGATLCSWVQNGGWVVPLTLIPLSLLAVNQHPQPVDDCPCFEDAIAFGSVVLGILLGKWGVSKRGISTLSVIMPGSGWIHTPDNGWIQVPRKWDDVLVWWSFATLKLVFGIFAIFAWRLLAKSALRLVLPPTYRLLAKGFRLPKRRFYTPATEYNSVPSGFSKEGGVLHTIPSVIDLPTGSGMDVEDGNAYEVAANGTGIQGRGKDVKLRVSGLWAKDKPGMVSRRVEENGEKTDVEENDKEGEPITHYDADVLIKLVVYSGIAILSSQALPALFNFLGWGVRSWPV